MSEVSTRPARIAGATIKKSSLTYDFPFIRTWRVGEIDYKDLNITGRNLIYTYKDNKKTVVFNNTNYIFNGILLTKQGDIFSATNRTGLSIMIECESEKNKEEKLFITIPCKRSNVTSKSLKSLIDSGVNIDKNVDIAVDVNGFIPNTDYYYYTYLDAANTYDKLFVVYDDSEVTISTADFDSSIIDNLQTVAGNYAFPILEQYKVSQSEMPAIRKPLDVVESEDIYIDCSPEGDANTRIIKPKRVFAIKKMDLFGLDAVEGYGKVFAFMFIAAFVLASVVYCGNTIHKIFSSGTKNKNGNRNNDTSDVNRMDKFKKFASALLKNKALLPFICVVYFLQIGILLARGPIMNEERDSFLKGLYSNNGTGIYILFSLLSLFIGMAIYEKMANMITFIYAGFSGGAMIGLRELVLSSEYKPDYHDIVLFSIASSLLYTLYQTISKSDSGSEGNTQDNAQDNAQGNA
jgi:hypothetical protein